jgi:type IV pilus assembly protein PilV
MLMRTASHTRARQGAFTMIEVLVTIVILAFGLLGLAGLQGRVHVAETESYGRAQAIELLQDMKARINANRRNAASYATTTPLGTGNSLQDCSALTGAALDLCEWNNALLGASETAGGQAVGAMLGGRGCISLVSATMPRQLLISVVWQGLSSTVAPAATTCGQGDYTDDSARRAVVATVTIGCLENDATTGLCVTP